MKRTTLAVLMIALAILAMAAPMAYAQAPAPKVTINGLIDNVTTYSQNIANYNTGIFNKEDRLWYYRTRGRFDFIGEVGKAIEKAINSYAEEVRARKFPLPENTYDVKD